MARDDVLDEWQDVTQAELDPSTSAMTEPTSRCSSIDGADETKARRILGAPLDIHAAATAAITVTCRVSKRITHGLSRGITSAACIRRRLRLSRMRVPTCVTTACTRAAMGHVAGSLLAPATSLSWRLAMSVADNHHVLIGACAATMAAAVLVWWPRCAEAPIADTASS